MESDREYLITIVLIRLIFSAIVPVRWVLDYCSANSINLVLFI